MCFYRNVEKDFIIEYFLYKGILNADYQVIDKIDDYDILFSCCSARRPILNRAHEAAATSGNKTTKSLVSAIKLLNFIFVTYT